MPVARMGHHKPLLMGFQDAEHTGIDMNYVRVIAANRFGIHSEQFTAGALTRAWQLRMGVRGTDADQ